MFGYYVLIILETYSLISLVAITKGRRQSRHNPGNDESEKCDAKQDNARQMQK